MSRFSVSKGTVSPLHPRKIPWGSVFSGLTVGSTAGHRMSSFLRVLNVFFMNLQRNTEAETAEMTNRCMRSPSNASLIKMPTFWCLFMDVGLENSTQEGKSMHTTLPIAAKIPCLKQTSRCVQITFQRHWLFLLFFTGSINTYLAETPAEHWGLGFFCYPGSTKLSHSCLDVQPHLHSKLWRTNRTCHCLLGQGFLFPLRFYYRL